MKMLSFLLTACCLCYSSFQLSAQEKPDQTESPYFYLPGEKEAGEQFPLLHTEADVQVAGVIANVTIKQVYKNDGPQAIEAIYVFPASTRAAIYQMEFTIGERIIVAKIEEKQKARNDYEQAKQKGQRAALLEQHRPNVFQMNVANILPGDRVEVRLKYTELLVPEEGTYTFVYPTVVGPRYAGETSDELLAANNWVSNPYLEAGTQVPYTFNLKVNLKAGLPIQQIQSPSHQININYHGKATAAIDLGASEKTGGDRDFILKYRLRGKEIEQGLLVHEGEKENYFMMMVQPPERVAPEQIPGREYIFIVDISGSMNGFPLETSKALLKDLIGQLRSSDRFNVLLFAGSAAFYSKASVEATPGNIEQAVQFIRRQRGSGGTRLLQAIQRAMAVPKLEGFSRSFVIATDGYVNVEAAAFDYIRDHLHQANFFSFGIGRSVNRHLIEGLARIGGGTPCVVTDSKTAPALAKKFKQYVETPVLTNIQLHYNDRDFYEVSPTRLPDLMGERPLVIFGKYRKNGRGSLRITGQNPGGSFSKTLYLEQASQTQGSEALSNLWARHRIQQLGDYTQLKGGSTADVQRIEEITRLGLQHNLLTAYTSFVAIDSEVVNQNGQTTVKQPLPLPSGVPNSAVGHYNARYGRSSSKMRAAPLRMERRTQLSEEQPEWAPPPPPPPPPAEPEVEEIFTVVEQMPRFPGCERLGPTAAESCAKKRLADFIDRHLRYPKHLGQVHIEGVVVVRFVVDKTGKIKDIEIVRSLHADLDQEAKRVVEQMPRWIPGTQRGKPVEVVYNLPIRFGLN
ncbi:MAG: TonB family protein [Bacteroidota bacterium]